MSIIFLGINIMCVRTQTENIRETKFVVSPNTERRTVGASLGRVVTLSCVFKLNYTFKSYIVNFRLCQIIM
jgi:hypothetical protein